MKIYVVTRARPGLQLTGGQLQAAEIPYLYAVSKNDTKGYPSGECEVFKAFGISDKRQAVMEANPNKFVMLDDDIKFLVRIGGAGSGKTEKCTTDQLVQLFQKIEGLLDNYQLVGVAERFMINHRPYPANYNCRQVHLFGIDGAWMKKKGIRFDRVPVAEDHDFVMQVIAAGGKQILITDFCHQDAPMFLPGGCGEWRTRKIHNDGHLKFHQLWPNFTGIREQDGMLRVQVAWKKLAKHYAKN